MATIVPRTRGPEALMRGIETQRDWLDPLGERLQTALSAALERGGAPADRARDALNGVWLGHPLHPALVSVPIGAWLMAGVLDLLGQRRAADRLVWLGVVSALPTALSGLADWQDQSGEPRRVGLVHALLNTAGLGCFVASGLARGAGRRGVGRTLSTAGLVLVAGGGYLGGELTYALGTGVDRNAWAPEPDDFSPVTGLADLPEGKLTGGEVEFGGQRRPLVFLRQGGKIYAIGAVCAHVGGPLAEGALVDGSCVECPWHGSRFDLTDGRVVRGPAAFAQPVYEVRERGGRIEVRLER
jgi:nitrite reductase/ring-hydroxylating ferredoxin subunit/uncharacterized membrane protein